MNLQHLTTPAVLALLSSACGGTGPVSVEEELELSCSIPLTDINSGAIRDGIPSLSNPDMAAWGEPDTDYVSPQDLVVGVVVGGQPVAIPLAIFWWHEIVNLDGDGYAVAVTHCPLTGSSLAFDRTPFGDVEFGVSGLLFRNNLMMFDRSGTSQSLWPQMLQGARCGPRDGTQLPTVPAMEVTLESWLALHPDSKVVTSSTDFIRDYWNYPYDDYRDLDSRELLFPLERPIDIRRPPKERVLGVPDGSGGIAYPVGELDKLGEAAVLTGSSSGGDYVVFWNRDQQGAMVFRPEADGRPLTFFRSGTTYFDEETRSEWRRDGLAIDGPLVGARLETIGDAFVAFWFSWPAFYPDIQIWTAP
jgi:hypothetical protein